MSTLQNSPFFVHPRHRLPRAVIFLSGGGTNALKLLESLKSPRFQTWEAAVLLTDSPETGAAIPLGEQFNVPVIALDIRQFYRDRGEMRVSLMTERGREIREEWTAELRKMLTPYAPDFGILAGFVPLTNLTADFPCLNVHPGDLTCEEDGRRVLAGLHTVPIEAAMARGHAGLRSSVIVAQTYTGAGGEMDSGPIIGLSPEVEIDWGDLTPEQVCENRSLRGKRPVGGFKDTLENIAARNQERLKVDGDWVVFPPAVADFAAGKFAHNANRLWFCAESGWLPVRTVIYGTDGSATPVREDL